MGLGASRPRAPDLRDGDFGVLPHLGVLLESTFARADGSGGGRGRLLPLSAVWSALLGLGEVA